MALPFTTATVKRTSSKLKKAPAGPSVNGNKLPAKAAITLVSNGVAAEGAALPPPPPLPKAASLPQASKHEAVLPTPPGLPAARTGSAPGAEGPLPPPPPNPPARAGVKRKTPAPLTGGLPAVVGASLDPQAGGLQAKALGAAAEPAAKRPRIGAAAKLAQALQPAVRYKL